ncbi:MAG: hypothetical protein CMJ18_01930 [Phycisphaeraceae bacterium]|nr:hypothetical protein [Phycisphaeraceae bacterium]
MRHIIPVWVTVIVFVLLSLVPGQRLIADNDARVAPEKSAILAPCTVQLRDGSRMLVSMPADTTFVVRSRFGVVRLPLASLKAIHFIDDQVEARLRDGNVVKGVLESGAIESKTSLGKLEIAPSVIRTMTVQRAGGRAPVPMLDPDEPGLLVPFDIDTRSAVVPARQYGIQPSEFINHAAIFDVRNEKATSAHAEARLVYFTTRRDDQKNATPMNPSRDWVFSMEWSTNLVNRAASKVFELGVNSRLDQKKGHFLKLQGTHHDGPRGHYRLLVSSGSSDEEHWKLIKQFDFSAAPDRIRRFTVHYRAASRQMDFWVDDTIEAGDIAISHGNYALSSLQVRGGPHGQTVDTFYDVAIGVLDPSRRKVASP